MPVGLEANHVVPEKQKDGDNRQAQRVSDVVAPAKIGMEQLVQLSIDRDTQNAADDETNSVWGRFSVRVHLRREDGNHRGDAYRCRPILGRERGRAKGDRPDLAGRGSFKPI